MFSHNLLFVYGSSRSKAVVNDYLSSVMGATFTVMEAHGEDPFVYLLKQSIDYRKLGKIAQECQTPMLVYEEISKTDNTGQHYVAFQGQLIETSELVQNDVARAKNKYQLDRYIQF